MIAYLMPRYDACASFYEKAYVDTNDSTGSATLYSYLTPVAVVESGAVELRPAWDTSPTTLSHVKEFLKQHGFKADTKAQIAKDYPVVL